MGAMAHPRNHSIEDPVYMQHGYQPKGAGGPPANPPAAGSGITRNNPCEDMGKTYSDGSNSRTIPASQSTFDF